MPNKRNQIQRLHIVWSIYEISGKRKLMETEIKAVVICGSGDWPQIGGGNLWGDEEVLEVDCGNGHTTL